MCMCEYILRIYVCVYVFVCMFNVCEYMHLHVPYIHVNCREHIFSCSSGYKSVCLYLLQHCHDACRNRLAVCFSFESLSKTCL
jgi:hypothetical protein